MNDERKSVEKADSRNESVVVFFRRHLIKQECNLSPNSTLRLIYAIWRRQILCSYEALSTWLSDRNRSRRRRSWREVSVVMTRRQTPSMIQTSFSFRFVRACAGKSATCGIKSYVAKTTTMDKGFAKATLHYVVATHHDRSRLTKLASETTDL